MTYDMSEFALTNREWDVMDFASGIDHALGGRDSQRTRLKTSSPKIEALRCACDPVAGLGSVQGVVPDVLLTVMPL